MTYTEEEILDIITSRNGFEFNHMKTIEELLELSEVLTKKLNKFGGPKEPSDQEIIDEIGDCELRLKILRRIYDSGKVDKRVREKLSKFQEYIETNKYKHI